MAKGLVTDTNLTHIADVIRTFNGTSDKYTPSEMAAEMIDAIPSSAPVLTESGSLVHITDAAASPAEECVTVLEPKQDLHGYDAPWPAGGGKNLLPISITTIKANNGIGTWNDNVYTRNGLTYTVNTNIDGYVTDIVINGQSSVRTDLYLVSKNDIWNNLKGYVGNKIYVNGCPPGGSSSTYLIAMQGLSRDGIGVSDTGNGALSDTINDFSAFGTVQFYIVIAEGYNAQNLVFKPMIRLASETDDTYEPYSNICPISGYTNVELIRTGKNLLKITGESHTANGITFTVNKDDAGNVVSVTANGTAQGNFSAFLLSTQVNYDSWKKFLGESIVFSGCPAGGSSSTYRMQYWQSDNLQYYDFGNGVTFDFPNPPSNEFNFAIFIASGYTANNLVFKPMIRLASDTDDTFEPYQDSVHTADWQASAGTVYGGEVDWANGSLSSEWAEIASYNGETLPDVWLSDRDAYAPDATPTIGAQVVYKLAEPIEYPLTPQIIELLKGVNSLWSDNGETSVGYIADLGLYINGLKERAREAISG